MTDGSRLRYFLSEGLRDAHLEYWVVTTMTGFGSALRAERERSGLTLERVCEETRVSLRHLEAVEAEEYAALPGGVFRRGIVKAYVNAVGLAEQDWLERFKASYEAYASRKGLAPENDDEAWAEFAENVKRNRTPTVSANSWRWAGVVLMLILLIVAAWAVWTYVLKSRLSIP